MKKPTDSGNRSVGVEIGQGHIKELHFYAKDQSKGLKCPICKHEYTKEPHLEVITEKKWIIFKRRWRIFKFSCTNCENDCELRVPKGNLNLVGSLVEIDIPTIGAITGFVAVAEFLRIDKNEFAELIDSHYDAWNDHYGPDDDDDGDHGDTGYELGYYDVYS